MSGTPATMSEMQDHRKPLCVLIVEHTQADAELCLQELKKAGFNVRADLVQTPEEFTGRLGSTAYDVILSDYRLPNWTGLEALALLQQCGKEIPFVLVTGTLGEEAAVECLKQGVSDYILKDRLARLPVAVQRVLKEKALREERARAEQALRESEAHYRIVAETASDAFVTINSESRILFVNAAAETIFGYTRAEMLGQDLTLLMPEGLREAHKEALRRYLETGQRHLNKGSVQLTGLHKAGAEIPLEVSFSALVKDGEPLFVGIIRDVTERKRAQEDLRQANEKLTAWVNDLEQHAREITLVNQMADLLHACVTPQEAYVVAGQAIPKLFSALSGALCVLDAARHLLEPVAAWGEAPVAEGAFPPEDCWALRRGRAHLLNGPDSGPACPHLGPHAPGVSLCVPMMAQGEALGVLLLQSGPAAEPGQPSPPREGLTEWRQRLAEIVADQVSLALANLRLREALRSMSVCDPLTGLFNRRYLEESLERELRRAVRKQRPVGMILLDIDHFKSFNDTFGHEAGDALLRELGSFLRNHTRREDIACRYGGEEFLLILPEAWLDITRQRAEQLREEIKQLRVQCRGQMLGTVTLSLGVAVFPEYGSNSSALLRAADLALYRAKAEGRDRVVVGQAIEQEPQAAPPHALTIHLLGKPK